MTKRERGATRGLATIRIIPVNCYLYISCATSFRGSCREISQTVLTSLTPRRITTRFDKIGIQHERERPVPSHCSARRWSSGTRRHSALSIPDSRQSASRPFPGTIRVPESLHERCQRAAQARLVRKHGKRDLIPTPTVRSNTSDHEISATICSHVRRGTGDLAVRTWYQSEPARNE